MYMLSCMLGVKRGVVLYLQVQLERMKAATEQAEKASPAFAAGLASGMMGGRSAMSDASTATTSSTAVLSGSNNGSDGGDGGLATVEAPSVPLPQRSRPRCPSATLSCYTILAASPVKCAFTTP